jgi:hypothetical protein
MTCYDAATLQPVSYPKTIEPGTFNLLAVLEFEHDAAWSRLYNNQLRATQNGETVVVDEEQAYHAEASDCLDYVFNEYRIGKDIEG